MVTKPRSPTYDELLTLVQTLQAENVALKVRIAEQDKRIEKLARQLAAANKNSTKPPSSDITKPPPDQSPKHESTLTLDDADQVVEFHVDQFIDNSAKSLASWAHASPPSRSAKGDIHASYSGAEKVLGFLGGDVCRATICNKIKKVALDFAYQELLAALPTEGYLN